MVIDVKFSYKYYFKQSDEDSLIWELDTICTDKTVNLKDVKKILDEKHFSQKEDGKMIYDVIIEGCR